MTSSFLSSVIRVPPQAPARARILLVEDEAIVALDIRKQLLSLGYEPVGHATTSVQALGLAQVLLPDLVLMDIHLGGAVDGVDTAQAIRARLSIPVIFVTAYADEDTLERAKQAEPFGYLTKPFSERELRSVLEMALHMAHVERRLRESELRYRNLLDKLQVGVLVYGPNGDVRLTNQKACDLLHAPASYLLGKTSDGPDWEKVCDDGSPFPVASRPVPLAIATGQPVRGVMLGLRGPGAADLVWLLVDAEPLLDAACRVIEVVCTLTDITARKQAEAALGESALHTQSILNNVVDAVITIDTEGRIQSFNKAATTIFGYAPAEVTGRNVALLMPDADGTRLENHLQHHDNSGEDRLTGKPREMEGRRKDGTLFPLLLALSRTESGGRPTYIGLIRDVSQQRLAEQEIQRLAFHDHLTGLPNRRLLMDRLLRAMSNAARQGQHGALMFLDLDHFKQLNDSLGHDVGDALLRQVAARLQGCLRDVDSVARMGGDEFVVLLEALSEHESDASAQVEVVANKILSSLGRPFALQEHRYCCTASIGIVAFLHGGENVDDLFKMADAAMYQAKSAGRNRARFYDPTMQAAAQARAALEHDLQRGLAQDEFLLYYQVQVNGEGLPVGAEALVRWQHPARGIVSPAEFIALAEQTGMILPLGQWVLETACAQLAQWATRPDMTDWTLAVNVSASQFAHADFVANVFRALEQSGARAERLKLELTESMLAVDIEDIIFKMTAIKSRGVSFALDDFGTGYSSLTYLKRLPLAQLKIDKSFVRDILTDPNDAAIARTILALGHTLGLAVIAEGVETREQHAFLAALGCDAFQGYLFGRPGPQPHLVMRDPAALLCVLH